MEVSEGISALIMSSYSMRNLYDSSGISPILASSLSVVDAAIMLLILIWTSSRVGRISRHSLILRSSEVNASGDLLDLYSLILSSTSVVINAFLLLP